MPAKSLRHKKNLALSDGADPSIAQPSDWNNDHDLWLCQRQRAGDQHRPGGRGRPSSIPPPCNCNNAGGITYAQTRWAARAYSGWLSKKCMGAQSVQK